MLNRLYRLCLLLAGLMLLSYPARAQEAGDEPTAIRAELSPPETDAFPRITTFLDVHDLQGQFLHGLQASGVRVEENGTLLPVEELEVLHNGVQVVLAVNPGPAFAIRDSQGISRYDLLVGALQEWATNRAGSTVDDLSILTNGGPELTHSASLTDWLAALTQYQPDARAIDPNLDLLLRAVEVASDATPRPGMERAILFITAPPADDLSFAVQNLIAQSQQQRVRLFIWLVASSGSFDTPQAQQLVQLANETDGGFFAFSGVEALPSPEGYFEPLRDIYRLTYSSQIATGGMQQVVAEIQSEGGAVRTAPQSFEFKLDPPDPAFIVSELEIRREYTTNQRATLVDTISSDDLSPKSHKLQVLIDFPDGHPRPVVKSVLFVDGKPSDENTSPPFDEFTWNLTGYTASGQHMLRVEVLDSMGLTGTSIETMFHVVVVPPAINPLAFLARYWPAFGGLATVLAVALAFLGLILGGRIKPYARQLPGRLRRSTREPAARRAEAVISAGARDLAPADDGDGRMSGWVNRLHWPQRRLAPKAHAFLTRLAEADPGANTAVPIPITAEEITIGRDPRESTLVLEDLSVDTLHARLILREDGTFWLADQGSVAGTWINYTLIPTEGALIQHGDLVHVGRIGFRFTQREPKSARKPVVLETPYDPI